MLGQSKPKVRDLNEHVTCAICGGYFIDATTIIECLHSFCRSCIVTHMMINRCCPKCEVPAHKTRPLLNIRSDKTLQDIVYKLVPNLLEEERRRKRKFHDETGIPMDAEEEKCDSITLTPEKKEHRVSLSLEYDTRELGLSGDSTWTRENLHFPKRYLRCYDAVFISTINKLVCSKLDRDDLEVLSFCRGEVLPETYTLSDVASTFSWKSDRPLSLTYMTFSSKCNKRKLPSPVKTDVGEEEVVPAKKLAVASTSCDETPQQSVAPITVDSTEQSKPQETSTICVSPKELTHPSLPRESKAAKSLPSAPISPWKPNSTPQQPLKPTQQVTGVKVMAYSVRNVPFVNVKASTSNKTEQGSMNQPSVSQPVVSSVAVRPSYIQSQSQSFAPLTSSNSQGKVKSINSIANRLQMEKVKLAPSKASPYAPVNVPDSVKVNSNSASSVAAKRSISSWIPGDMSANMKRNLMAQTINASSFKNQSFKEESKNNLIARQGPRSGPSSSHGPSPRGDARLSQFSVPNQGNFVRFNRPAGSNPPNYTQATDQRVKFRMAQPAPTRPNFRDMLRHIRGEQKQQNFTRPKKVSEDPQLLSTTRQLASLREQQKLLNEIAAAVALRGSNQRTTESLRAAMSGLSPKSSSPRITSHIPATTNAVRKPYPSTAMHHVSRAVRPTPPIITGTSKITGMADSNGSIGMSHKVNGSKSFNEVSQLSKDMGHPSMNKRRDGGIDIYQNTIARAKAQLREMNMKDRAIHQHRTQIRAAISPYNVQSPMSTRKVSPTPYRPPTYSNYMQRGSPSTASVSSMNHLNRSSTSNYRGVTTKPPPPPPSSQRYLSPNVFQNSLPNRYQRPPPPPTSHRRIPQAVARAADSALPEQDQPLCLVMKK